MIERHRKFRAGFFGQLALIAFLSMGASVGNTAELLVNGSGKLTGANRVDVGGEFWDVRFVDDTCIAAFTGCERFTTEPRDLPTSSFLFGPSGFGGNITEAAAIATGGAIGALLEQVFVDGPLGDFDSNPNLTFGITDASAGFTDRARIMTPFRTRFPSPSQPGVIGVAEIIEVLNGFGADRASNLSIVARDADLSADAGAVFATWSPSPVPIPAAAYLFLSALGLVFGSKKIAAKRA